MLVSDGRHYGRDMNEANQYPSVDGYIAQRFFTISCDRSDESIWHCIFRSGLYVAGTPEFAAGSYLAWYGGRDSPDHTSEIFWNTYWYYVHNLYTGMEKAWVSQHEMLLMLSLLILSADVGYGLARDGISTEAAVFHLKMGGIEAVCGAVGFALFYGTMKVFLKGIARELPEAETQTEQNFIKCRLGDMASSFRKLSHMLTNEIPQKENLSEGEMAQAFSELTENMCAACGRREHCWEKRIL